MTAGGIYKDRERPRCYQKPTIRALQRVRAYAKMLARRLQAVLLMLIMATEDLLVGLLLGKTCRELQAFSFHVPCQH